jgi:2-polyprenyl-6-methoxyphenol hydroxylase-like FAD-dependent oxidoreductase
LKTLVVGGGIGGLSATIALWRIGVEAVVFERAGKLREIGAGISLWANAMKALRKLRLADAIQAVGVPALGGEVRSSDGETISEIPAAAMEERFGVNVGLHRADLQKTLLAALDGHAVRLGAEFMGFEQDGRGVRARFADGREERGDLLIGADGLHSAVRAQLFRRWAAPLHRLHGLARSGEARGRWVRVVGPGGAVRAGEPRTGARVLVRYEECAGRGRGRGDGAQRGIALSLREVA